MTTFISFTIAELAYRLYKFGFSKAAIVTYFRVDEWTDLIRRSYPIEINPTYGWVPSQKYNNQENSWQTTINVLDDSSRSNGQPKPKDKNCSVLAVGDSFTFGDEVSDNESWPAYLEKNLNCPVLNAGVCAYGIDQASLRAKMFIEKYHPKILVFSIIMDDIFRTRQPIRQGLPKPYYTIENDKLVLYPITPELIKISREYVMRKEADRFVRDFFDRSYIIHDLMDIFAPMHWRGIQDLVLENKPVEISCRLLRDLDQFTQERNISFVLVYQHLKSFIVNPNEMIQSLEITECLKGTKISVFDTHYALKAVADKDMKTYDSFYLSHMTGAGNKITADAIAEYMRQIKIVR